MPGLVAGYQTNLLTAKGFDMRLVHHKADGTTKSHELLFGGQMTGHVGSYYVLGVEDLRHLADMVASAETVAQRGYLENYIRSELMTRLRP